MSEAALARDRGAEAVLSAGPAWVRTTDCPQRNDAESARAATSAMKEWRRNGGVVFGCDMSGDL